MMLDAEFIRWILTGLMGVIMFLGKRALDENSDHIKDIGVDIQNLKDTRLHKDDFREFKLELRGQFEEIKSAIRDLKTHAS